MNTVQVNPAPLIMPAHLRQKTTVIMPGQDKVGHMIGHMTPARLNHLKGASPTPSREGADHVVKAGHMISHMTPARLNHLKGASPPPSCEGADHVVKAGHMISHMTLAPLIGAPSHKGADHMVNHMSL